MGGVGQQARAREREFMGVCLPVVKVPCCQSGWERAPVSGWVGSVG